MTPASPPSGGIPPPPPAAPPPWPGGSQWGQAAAPWPGYAPPPPYRSLAPKRRAIAVLAVFVGLAPLVFLALHAFMLVSAFQSLSPTFPPPPGSNPDVPPGFAAAIVGAMLAVLAMALVMFGVNVAQALVVGFWGRDAANNVRAFGAQGLTWSPGWAIGGWFIPYANYVIPFLVLREIWRATEAPLLQGRDWRQVPVPSWTGWWWGLWVASSVVPAMLVVPVEMLVLITGMPPWILAIPLLLALAVVAAAYVHFMRFVDAITQRQDAVAKQLRLA